VAIARWSVLAPAISSGCGRPMQSARSAGRQRRVLQVLAVRQVAVAIDHEDQIARACWMPMLRAALESRRGLSSRRTLGVVRELRHQRRCGVGGLAIDDEDLEPIAIKVLVDQLREVRSMNRTRCARAR